MKKRILSLTLCAALSLCSVSVCSSYRKAVAEDYNVYEFMSDNVYFPTDILSTDYYSNKVDYSLWNKFIKYDLCITDYDSLTDKEKELCRFIFETEQSAQGAVRCERARRILAGEDVGERVTLSEIQDGINIENVHGSKISGNYSYHYYNSDNDTNVYCYRECAPDIMHIDDNINVYEYWLDDNGTEKILHSGDGIKDYNNHYGYFTHDKEMEDFVNEYKDKFRDEKIFMYKDEKRFCVILSDDGILSYKPIKGRQKWDAEVIKKDKIVYAVLPDDTAVVVDNEFKSDDAIDKLVIPNEIRGHEVNGIEKKALQYINASEISLPDSIKYINDYAFDDCKHLKNINIPKKLTYIGKGAFDDCYSLENLEIDCPDLKLTNGCICDSSLKSIDLNVKSIGEYAFEYEHIKNITLHEGIESIGTGAFRETDIKDIEIPSTVKSIGAGAFSGTGITALEIPDSVKIVGALPEKRGIDNTWIVDCPATDPLTDEQELILDAEGTIFGTYGSEAEKYAKENNIEFVDIDSVRLSKNKMNIIVGEEDDLQVKNYNGEVQWKSEDESIAAVENGTVKALGEGTTNILAIVGDKTLSCKVAVSTTAVTTTRVTTTTTTTTTTTGESKPSGDANGDNRVDVRDCAFIANRLAKGEGKNLPMTTDFNGDGKVDVRDAAAIARYLSKLFK